MNNNDVVELDLIMFIKKLMLQWKAILIIAIVFGIVGMQFQYMRAVSAAKVAEQAGDTDVKSLLTDDEIESVDTAVSLNKKISDLESYISESLYMTIDPLDYKEVSLVVTIHASAGTDSRDIATLYVSEMLSNEFVDKIIDGMGKKTTASYVNNLMYASHQKDQSSVDITVANTDQVNLNIIVPKGWDGDKLSEIVKSAVDEINISNYANQYTASIDYNAVRENSSFEVQQRQKSITDAVSALKSQLATATAEFTDNQKQLYEEETAVEDEEETEDAVVMPQRSGKYFVVSLLAGIVLYVCVYGCIVIFGKTVFVEYSGSANILTMVCLPKTKRSVLDLIFDDKIMRKLLFKKEMDLDAQMQSMAQDIEVLMKGRDNKTLYMVGTNRVFDEMKDSLSKYAASVDLRYIEVKDMADIMNFVKEIKPEESYITVVEDKNTKRENLAKLLRIETSGEIYNVGQMLVL